MLIEIVFFKLFLSSYATLKPKGKYECPLNPGQ